MSSPVLAANTARPSRGTCIFLLGPAFLLFSTLALAQLTLTPASLPNPSLGENYYQELHVAEGTAPYRWIATGDLPPGITFDTPSATLAGIPTASGSYRFTITVSDSARRRLSREYLLRIGLGNTITIAWTRTPASANGAISGEVEVSNPGREVFDLTFIAVAVNEIGRATALGYQRFSFGPGKQKIPFGTTLPRGSYVVHADAIGEIASSRTIRRARLQSRPLAVP